MLVRSNGGYDVRPQEASISRQASSFRSFSITRLRNVSISYESVMDPLEELLLALLLQLVGRIIFPVSWLLTISMSVTWSFLDDVPGIKGPSYN